MSNPIYDSLAGYATPPHNYIGTFLFLSYIALALYATLSIVVSLYTQYTRVFSEPTSDARIQAARAKHIKIYAFLGSLSFTALSYHMLMFLVTHYLAWSREASAALSPVVSLAKLQRWMLDSTLFRDFAGDLVRDAPNAVWTQAAILATWFWNIYMAQKARARGIDAWSMRLFVLLSQILPISFTVALFLVQLHLMSPDIQTPMPDRDPAKSVEPPTKSKPRASLQIPNVLLNAALLAQMSLQNHVIFSPLLFFERAILLLPHSGLVSLRDSDVVKCITVSGGFAMANAAMRRKDLSLGTVVAALKDGGFAAKALGWDTVLGALVYVVLGWGGGV